MKGKVIVSCELNPSLLFANRKDSSPAQVPAGRGIVGAISTESFFFVQPSVFHPKLFGRVFFKADGAQKIAFFYLYTGKTCSEKSFTQGNIGAKLNEFNWFPD